MWRPSGGADVRGKLEFWLDPPVLCAMEAHIVPARIVENKGRGCFRPLELTSPRGKKLPNSPLSPLQSSSSPAVIARNKPTPHRILAKYGELELRARCIEQRRDRESKSLYRQIKDLMGIFTVFLRVARYLQTIRLYFGAKPGPTGT